MTGKWCWFTASVLFLLLPGRLMAGGPPSLCVPIDGVTDAAALECAKLLTAQLKERMSPHYLPQQVRMFQHDSQWYMMMLMGDNVSLCEIEAALQGSDYSIARDRLRLFDHVILEIDAGDGPADKLLAGLEAIEHVEVVGSETKEKRWHVTVKMPHAAGFAVRQFFSRPTTALDPSARFETATVLQQLPSFDTFRAVVTQHGATLSDIRWSNNYACRPLGAIVLADVAQETTAHTPPAVRAQ